MMSQNLTLVKFVVMKNYNLKIAHQDRGNTTTCIARGGRQTIINNIPAICMVLQLKQKVKTATEHAHTLLVLILHMLSSGFRFAEVAKSL